MILEYYPTSSNRQEVNWTLGRCFGKVDSVSIPPETYWDWKSVHLIVSPKKEDSVYLDATKTMNARGGQATRDLLKIYSILREYWSKFRQIRNM